MVGLRWPSAHLARLTLHLAATNVDVKIGSGVVSEPLSFGKSISLPVIAHVPGVARGTVPLTKSGGFPTFTGSCHFPSLAFLYFAPISLLSMGGGALLAGDALEDCTVGLEA